MNQLLLTASTMCGTFPQLLTSSVGGVSWAVRTDLFVLGRSRKRAKLTLVTPASPPITAALGLRDKVAAAGRHLAHGLQHLSEAESLSVVWNHMWGVSVSDTEHPPSSSNTRSASVFLPGTNFLKDKYCSLWTAALLRMASRLQSCWRRSPQCVLLL